MSSAIPAALDKYGTGDILDVSLSVIKMIDDTPNRTLTTSEADLVPVISSSGTNWSRVRDDEVIGE